MVDHLRALTEFTPKQKNKSIKYYHLKFGILKENNAMIFGGASSCRSFDGGSVLIAMLHLYQVL